MSMNLYSEIIEACNKANININLAFIGMINDLIIKRGLDKDVILNNIECLVQ